MITSCVCAKKLNLRSPAMLTRFPSSNAVDVSSSVINLTLALIAPKLIATAFTWHQHWIKRANSD